MPTFKATWFYNDSVNNVGWTETWWANATNHDAVNTLFNNYDSKRVALLMDSASIIGFRVSNVDGPRDSKYFNPLTPIVGTIPRATNPPAGVWDCLLIRRDVGTHDLLGHMFMHMVPAGIFNGRNYLASGGTPAGWYASFTAFLTEVTSGSYLLRKQAGAGPSYVPCTDFTVMRRTERRLGRPGDPLRGRRRIA